MALTEETRLGAYEILSPLGAGRIGEVYLAKDKHSDPRFLGLLKRIGFAT
jgi:hypothetical protein